MTDLYDPQIEKMPKEKLENLQSRLLRDICSFAWNNSKFYRNHWSEYPGGIEALPFLTKQHMVDTFPFGLCAVPRQDLGRMSLTSGSTGKPTITLRSHEDLAASLRFSLRRLVMRGIRKTDVVQMTMAYGLWAAGINNHMAVEKLGCFVIPSGPGNTKRQLWLMQTMGTTVLFAVPSYHLRIAEVGEQIGVDFESLPLRIAVSAAGKLESSMREEIEKTLCVEMRNSYGMSEVGGIATECEATQGLHAWSDELYLEIIDPETEEVLGEGERGELVITSLTRHAMPIIRYRTGDEVRILSSETCECGRTHPRLSGEIERLDDSVKIRGVLVRPGAIERQITRYPELTGNILIQVRPRGRPGLLCELLPSVETAFLNETTTAIVEDLKNKIGLTFEVRLVSYGELPTEREGKRVQVMPPSS